jgi:hypothetical protein
MPPVIVPCAADTWVKVATAVTSAAVHKRNDRPSLYIQTFVATGGAAPTTDDDAVKAFNGCDSFIFSESASSDIYIKAVKKAGEVRVDA